MSAAANPAHGALYGSEARLLGPLAARLLERGKLKWIIAISASLGAILEVIDTSIINVALPDIRGNLGATLAEAGWVSTGYSCANVVIIPLTAWLGDRFGKKRYFLFSLVGFTVSSVLCGLSTNLATLVLARVLQGLAGGGLLAKAQSIVFESFTPEERGPAQAIFALGVIAGPALGPVLGGWLTDNMGWRWIFFINIPFGILAAMMISTFFPNDEPAKLRSDAAVDWAGIGLLTVGLGCLQTMLEEGQQDDWFGSRFITLMAFGAVAGLALFVWRELTAEHPAVALRVLRHRSVAAGSLYSVLLGIGIFGVVFAVPIFAQDYLHFTATQSGLLQVPGTVAAAVAMILFGKIGGRFDPRMMVACGALITVVSAFMLAGINPSTGTNSLFWPLILRSVGSVVMFLPLSIATLGPLPKAEIADGAGFYSLTRQLGSSLGIAGITTLLARREAVHRAALVENVSLFHPAAVERLNFLREGFSAHGADPVTAQHRALGVMDAIINGQSALLAFADIFRYVGVAFIVTLPLLLLLGRGGRAAEEASAAAH